MLPFLSNRNLFKTALWFSLAAAVKDFMLLPHLSPSEIRAQRRLKRKRPARIKAFYPYHHTY